MFLSTKIRSAKKINRGFTLLEVMIAVVIVGILAGIVVARYPNVIKKTKIVEADGILAMMRESEIRYHIEHDGAYAGVSAGSNPLDVDIPGCDGRADSNYFSYTASSGNGTVTAGGKTGTAMEGVTVTLTIAGVRSVSGL